MSLGLLSVAALPNWTQGESGGDLATTTRTHRNAYRQITEGLSAHQSRRVSGGQTTAIMAWGTPPNAQARFDGLGPTFNNMSCFSCHHFGGRGEVPREADGKALRSALIRLSIASDGSAAPEAVAPDTQAATQPHPIYGTQLQDKAIPGVPAEGRATIHWRATNGTYPDGTPYELRVPEIHIEDLAFGPLEYEGASALISLRIAQPIYGLGLLEALSESTIRALTDPDDVDGDGISGRVNEVAHPDGEGTVMGRFGWKAAEPDLRTQTAAAAFFDMGLTSELFPRHQIHAVQEAANLAPDGNDRRDGHELTRDQLDDITLLMQATAVPARRDADDPRIVRGAAQFEQIGCAGCHIPTLATGVVTDMPWLSEQTIHPYTDLLLHDMGPDLADGRPDLLASGSEWRTPPLWGIGLTQQVNRRSTFLHDGRARTLEEAILWHGGEAQAVRDAFMALPAEARAEVLAFLESL